MSRRAWRSALAVAFVGVLGWGSSDAVAAEQSYESLREQAVAAHKLRSILRPFIITCQKKQSTFRRLFCEALNERLKAQHQARMYRVVSAPSAEGPLVARFVARPEPTLELRVIGCLTCSEPMLQRAGGDISRARFFMFKLPKSIRIRRRANRGRSHYDFGDLSVGKVLNIPLPKGTTKKVFDQRILPHVRLELLFRPVAGVTKVGRRFKYGVLTFELSGHRVYHKCDGRVFRAEPPMRGRYRVDKEDLSCPQNQPAARAKKAKKVKLPAKLGQAKVKQLLGAVGADLHTCFNQHGVAGEAPTDIVVAPSGEVKQARVLGKLADSPSARCVERLVLHVRFPPFTGEPVRVQWPFTLQQ